VERSSSRPKDLAKAYNTVGDKFRQAGQQDKALSLYRKGAKTATEAGDIAYSNLSIAVTYLSQRMSKEALPYLESTIKLPNCPPYMLAQAKQILAAVRKAD